MDPALAQELALLPGSATFAAWLAHEGPEVPDPRALPSRPVPWPPHEGLADPEAWPARRAAILAAWCRWLIGDWPAPPAEVAVERDGPVLRLGWDGAARLHATLHPAPAPGGRPAPVLVVQAEHAGWAEIAVEHGWAALTVAAGDQDDEAAAFPEAGRPWRSAIGRRAWALARALDGLHALGDPALDLTRVAVAGHSRNGKAALVAAAFDERFAAVVSSSSGVLGAMPIRRLADADFGEGVELLTRMYPHWYEPRLRLFAGREDRLPTDAHELLACVAPRPLLLSVALDDQVESASAAREVHGLLRDHHRWRTGRPGGPTLLWRTGGHSARLDAIEAHQAWLDAVVRDGRAAPAVATLPRGPLLGRAAAEAGVRRTAAIGPTGVRVDLHLPVDGPPRGLALWCAPLCRATGWQAGYEQAEPLTTTLVRAGMAVAAWDPPGCGERVREPDQTPAQAAREAQGVLDAALVALRRTAGALPTPVLATGYGFGADVALALGGRDARVDGVALAGPSPAAVGTGLGALAGRPVLVVVPRWSLGEDAARLAEALEAAPRWPGLERATPADFRFGAPARAAVATWAARRLGPSEPEDLAAASSSPAPR